DTPVMRTSVQRNFNSLRDRGVRSSKWPSKICPSANRMLTRATSSQRDGVVHMVYTAMPAELFFGDRTGIGAVTGLHLQDVDTGRHVRYVELGRLAPEQSFRALALDYLTRCVAQDKGEPAGEFAGDFYGEYIADRIGITLKGR